jgi:hypothetical protein
MSTEIPLDNLPSTRSPYTATFKDRNDVSSLHTWLRFGVTVSPDDTGGRVASELDRYIAICKDAGKQEWSNSVQRKLAKFKAVTLEHPYDLNISIIEYHHAPGEMRQHTSLREIHKFSELFAYLEEAPSASLHAQIVLLPLDPQLLDKAIGFFRRHWVWAWTDERHLDCAAVIALALLDSRWNIDSASLHELHSSSETPKTTPSWTEVLLPSLSDSEVPSRVKQNIFPMKASVYSTDPRFYLYRPHCQKPSSISVRTLYVEPPREGRILPWRALITCSNAGLLKATLDYFRTERSNTACGEISRRTEDPRYTLSRIDAYCAIHTSQILQELSQNIVHLVRYNSEM